MASITKRPNGVWRARYRDETGREHTRHFKRKVDGQRWLDEVTASIITGAYVQPNAGKVTFDQWFREWSARQVWAPMTVVQSDLVRRTVTFGDVPLGSLRPSHFEQWVRAMVETGFSPFTIRTRMGTVRTALRAAVRDRRIASDPSAGVALPRTGRREATMQVATSAEVGRLLDASVGWMRAFIGLCAFAGLRLGEASGVNVDDIDFLRRRLTVQRQVQKRRGGPSEIRPPKYGSVRTVFLPDELMEMLATHIQRYPSREGWLFTGASDQPIPPSNVNHWWTKAVSDAGLKGVKIHALRHYYASGLIAAGCDVVTVQRALGHQSASVTLNVYSHLWPTAEDRTREAAGGLAAAAIGTDADPLRTGDPD